MRYFIPAIARRGAIASVLLALSATLATAQRRDRPEFTQQIVLVSNFRVIGSGGTPSFERADLRHGRRVGDQVRDKLGDLLNKREAKTVSGTAVRESMQRQAYPPDTVLTLQDLKLQGQYFRADEIVVGTAVSTENGGVRLDADIILWRDLRMRQPIEPVIASSLDLGAKELAARISKARSQLRHQRRCENSLREGKGTSAIQSAREGIAGYPRGSLVRTCLVWALRATGAPAEAVLAEAKAILEIDSRAPHAMEAAAVSLDSLRRRGEAAEMWLRLAATDSSDLELIERVVWAMVEGGNSRRAEPLIVAVSNAHPENIRLVRQKWRVANDNRNWPLAVASGENLLAADPEAASDSMFFLRLAAAYRANGQIFKGVELVSRAVTKFPQDSRLYALYTQFVKEEADTVIPRGLELYPGSAEMRALNAKDLRAKGRVAESLDASKKALELDSTIAQGRMMIAQAEIDLGRPDSALVMLHRAADAGEDVNAVAQFALSKGNALLRAANGTKARADFQLAMSYFLLADSLKSTPQTKFLLGAAALSVAQMALTDAPKIAVKEESCAVSRLGADTIPIARESLEAGVDVSPEATKEFLDYLELIRPYAEKQIAAFCVAAIGNGVPAVAP